MNGSSPASSGKTADQKSVACFPRTGSRLSVCRISRLTALMSAPRSSASTSRENAGRSNAPFAAEPFPGRFIPLLLSWEIFRGSLASACERPASQKTHPDFPARRGTSRRFLLFPRVCGLRPCGCARSFPRGVSAGGPEAPQQFVEPHQADFRVAQRFEVQQIFKFFFELVFRFFLLG